MCVLQTKKKVLKGGKKGKREVQKACEMCMKEERKGKWEGEWKEEDEGKS